MPLEIKFDTKRSASAQVLALYANQAREVYEQRTAGDYTFTGLLSEFLWDLEERGAITIHRSK